MLPPLGKSNSKRNVEAESYDNPFRLPGDDQIFRMREEERRNKEDAKQRAATMKVWEKTHKEVQSATERLQEMLGDDKLLKLKDVVQQENESAKMMMPRRQEKENTADFVAKKREMFLVQMSLDTKREEIRKLEEKAQMKEEALQRSEQMLEEDAMRFDAFLKENDKKAHDAIKRAEEETKRKQEKNQEIKRLTQQIQAVNSEMSKHREALEDCLRYKNFLDMLTPPEHFEQHARDRQEKIARMKKEQHDVKHKEWEKMRRRLVEKHRKEVLYWWLC
jgi:chromosome segregation ATPase